MRAGAILIALVLAACSSTPLSPIARTVGVDNGTTLTVTISVNGQRLADIPPRSVEPALDLSSAPALPWTVQARSRSRYLCSVMTGPIPAISLMKAVP